MHLVICDKRREFPSLAKEIQKKKKKRLNLVLPRMSTFIQAVGCWLLNQIIYSKFVFSKKATKIEEIFTVNLTLCSKCQIDGEDFVEFCGLLRKHEL